MDESLPTAAKHVRRVVVIADVTMLRDRQVVRDDL
jgi:hypothetical protein